MTKRTFYKDSSSFSVRKAGIPTHSVVGTPVEFYVYVAGKGSSSWSKWIKGNIRLYYELKTMHAKHDLDGLIKAIEELHAKN